MSEWNTTEAAHGHPLVTAKELQRAVQDLQTTEPLPGLIKTLVLGSSTVAFLVWAMAHSYTVSGAVGVILAGVVFGAWIITTHDAIHHTLTGWAWFDELVPRLFSFPMIWCHGTYSEIHKLHHQN